MANRATAVADRVLTGKQRMFVAEYLTDLNATQAAIRAGYSRTGASATGSRNLKKPHIRAAIAAAQAPRLAKLAIDADEVLAELARIARANVLDYMRIGADGEPIVDFSGLDREAAAALSEVAVDEVGRGSSKGEVRRIRFRLHDKLAALRELAKHFDLMGEPLTADDTAPGVEPEHDARQVARAVIAILESARTTGGSAGT